VEQVEKYKCRAQLGAIFTPSAPIGRKDFFSGRGEQVHRVLDAIFQMGQHVIIYGERGVGKTSLANVLTDYLSELEKYNYKLVRYNCAATSKFHSIWEGVFREFSFVRNTQIGFTSTPTISPLNIPFSESAGSEDVRFILQQIGTSAIVVIDEYDRVNDPQTSSLLADTIKSLSDHAVDTTLIIIGVADSIDELIAEHRSIERAIVQIQMPRMSDGELVEIVDRGFQSIPMDVGIDVKQQIAALSRGLPHNTHELALFAGYAALDENSLVVSRNNVDSAIKHSVSNAQQTIVSSYNRAISSPHQNIYKEILLAAALAPTDELGYFAAGDLRKPLSIIAKKTYGIDAYMRHLNQFCSEARGKILEKKGERRRYRFRFHESIMEPFVIMKGIKDALINEDAVLALESASRGAFTSQ
jgi:GTPase SAR1 family protein